MGDINTLIRLNLPCYIFCLETSDIHFWRCNAWYLNAAFRCNPMSWFLSIKCINVLRAYFLIQIVLHFRYFCAWHLKLHIPVQSHVLWRENASRYFGKYCQVICISLTIFSYKIDIVISNCLETLLSFVLKKKHFHTNLAKYWWTTLSNWIFCIS